MLHRLAHQMTLSQECNSWGAGDITLTFWAGGHDTHFWVLNSSCFSFYFLFFYRPFLIDCHNQSQANFSRTCPSAWTTKSVGCRGGVWKCPKILTFDRPCLHPHNPVKWEHISKPKVYIVRVDDCCTRQQQLYKNPFIGGGVAWQRFFTFSPNCTFSAFLACLHNG